MTFKLNAHVDYDDTLLLINEEDGRLPLSDSWLNNYHELGS